MVFKKMNDSLQRKNVVLLFSLESINNAGDEILRVTTEYLIKQISSCRILRIQLKPREEDMHGQNRLCWYMGTILRKFSKYIPNLNLSYRIKNIGYIVAYNRVFQNRIKEADKVILPIGMLKYSTQDFSYVFNLITSICTKLGKPVLLSGMSPEIENSNDWRYKQLVNAVNEFSVKMITTRDGQKGVDIIKSQYLKRAIPCDYVGDPALWIPETYNVKRRKTTPSSPTIGINIIRKGIFEDYNKSFTDDELFAFYSELILLLDEKGWGWKLFCNGIKSDWKVIEHIASVLKIQADRICPIPQNGDEFVNMIIHFDAVFGARLHTCITSVSLSVPVVGFVWDDKIKYFSETMGIERFFFHPSNMTAEKVVNAMESAMNFKIDVSNRDKYKQKTLESIRNFIDS